MSTSSRRFALIYDVQVREHLAAIERKHHSLIRRTIERQLRHEPDIEARNRKPLLRASVFGAAREVWELRLGPGNRFRVFYTVDAPADRVLILAIGVKVGNRLWIGGEEFEL